MGLRDIGATLPPGFRFYPSDEELVCHYLYKKIANEDVLKGTLVEIDLHTCEPWQLPEVAKLNSTEWYFFSFRDRKYATGYRTNRATISGYWKATGKDRTIVDHKSNSIVGMRKTLVFYKNRAPNGIKTGWIMHEFRRENQHIPPKEDWVLCRVFHKAKSENSDELTLQNALDTTTVANSPHLSASPPTYYQTFPRGYYQTTSLATECLPHLQNHNNNTSIINLPDFSSLNPSLPYLSQAPPNEMIDNSNCVEDKYGYLFDMVFEDSNLGDGVPSNMEDMRFDGDDDSGRVFL